MWSRVLAALSAVVLFPAAAAAQCGSIPNTLTNGQNADATQVMANFNFLRDCINNGVQKNAANVWAAGQSSAPVQLAFAATITPSFASGNIFTVTLTGNATLANPSNLVAGQCGQIFITQDGTGSRTLAYGTQWKFPGGTAPTLTTAANATDILSFCSWTTSAIAAQLTANVR